MKRFLLVWAFRFLWWLSERGTVRDLPAVQDARVRTIERMADALSTRVKKRTAAAVPVLMKHSVHWAELGEADARARAAELAIEELFEEERQVYPTSFIAPVEKRVQKKVMLWALCAL